MEDQSPAGMLERVERILEVFERSTGALTLSKIAVRSGLPRSSVHRILQQLIDARWLVRDRNEYRLGLRMFEIGSLAMHRDGIVTAARPILQNFWVQTGHVVHLAVLDGQDIVYVDRIGGAFANYLPSRVGSRYPAHCTAVGKAALAFSPRPVIEGYLRSDLRRRTAASIGTSSGLAEELAGIRVRGFAVERGEAVAGVACIGAPVTRHGDTIAAISVCGLQNRMHIEQLIAGVMGTAANLSRRLSATRLSDDLLAQDTLQATVNA